MIENYFNSYDPERYHGEVAKQLDHHAPVAHVDAVDWKNKSQIDILAIPSSANIMAMSILSPEEQLKQKQLHSFDNIKFDLDNEEVEGPFLYD